MPHPKLVEYTSLISQIPPPDTPETLHFLEKGKLVICLIEFRILEEIKWVINAVLKIYPKCDIGLSIVYGKNNSEYIETYFKNWGNINLIKTQYRNLDRGTYSSLLKQPQFYEQFSNFSHILIYQTDSLILRKIDDVYFNYDYIGAPWKLENQCAKFCAGNGGFSLRCIKSCIKACESNRNLKFERIHRGNEDVFFCSHNWFKYPEFNTEHHKSFAVERVYKENPIGVHQLHLCAFPYGKWDEIKSYIKKQLFENINILPSDQCIPDKPNLIYPPQWNNDNNNKPSHIVFKPQEDIKQITEKLDESIKIGPFTIELTHVHKNRWNIQCTENYEVLFCKTKRHDTVVFSELFECTETATIHKKETGVYYYQYDNDIYIVFCGFPNGGGCWSDINISNGEKYSKNLPKNGSIIIKSTKKSIQKVSPIYLSSTSLLNFTPSNCHNDYKLIFNLYSGVGYYNQLFSFELALYFASLSKRHLILYIAHPLVHAGRVDRQHGILLDYLNDEYKDFLPSGMTVIKYDEKLLPTDYTNIKLETNVSNSVFVDNELFTQKNKSDIKDFANFRNTYNFSKLDDLFDPNKKIVRFTNSNAARMNTGFYTNNKNYNLMNNIIKSVSGYNQLITSISNEIIKTVSILPENLISIHFRFGDIHKKASQINLNSEQMSKNIINWAIKKFPNKDAIFLIMCDRKDSPKVFNDIKDIGFKLLFTDELITKEHKLKLRSKFKNTNVAEFCVQKKICEYSQYFIGNYGSTVTVSLAGNMWYQNKDWNMFTHSTHGDFNKETLTHNLSKSNSKYTWKKRNLQTSHPTSWCYFSPDFLSR